MRFHREVTPLKRRDPYLDIDNQLLTGKKGLGFMKLIIKEMHNLDKSPISNFASIVLT